MHLGEEVEEEEGEEEEDTDMKKDIIILITIVAVPSTVTGSMVTEILQVIPHWTVGNPYVALIKRDRENVD